MELQLTSIDNAMDILLYSKNSHLYEFVRLFNGNDGFSFAKNPEINELWMLLEDDVHSCFSFAICLRTCQKQLRKQYNLKKLKSVVILCVFFTKVHNYCIHQNYKPNGTLMIQHAIHFNKQLYNKVMSIINHINNN
jgi:hypothetical protein